MTKKGERRKPSKRANKLAVHKRASRRKQRKNPTYNMAKDLRAAGRMAQDAALFSFAAAALNLFLAYGGKVGKFETVKIDCVCGGSCLCHSGLQIAGVPCPADCINAGTQLDGCHRCDCAQPAKVQ
jgi:hypothetical protein